jgi:hypothetical protein
VLQCGTSIPACVEGFIWIHHIQKSVRYSLPLLGSGLVRSNIHSAIHLARIRCQNLGVKMLGYVYRDPTFTNGRWPQQDDQWPMATCDVHARGHITAEQKRSPERRKIHRS